MNGSANVMTCEKMHARIPITTCLGRQTKGIGNWDAGPRLIPVECRECEQGKEILAIVKNPENAAKATTKPKRPKGVEEMKRWERAKGCSNCRRDKTIVGGGLCMVCRRAVEGKAGEEREAALAEVKRKLDAGEIKTRRSKHQITTDKSVLPAKPVQLHGEFIQGKVSSIARPVRLEASEAPSIVPITLRLAIEITVKVNGIGI